MELQYTYWQENLLNAQNGLTVLKQFILCFQMEQQI